MDIGSLTRRPVNQTVLVIPQSNFECDALSKNYAFKVGLIRVLIIAICLILQKTNFYSFDLSLTRDKIVFS